MPGLAALAEVATGVVLDRDRELQVAFEVLVDPLDHRGPAGQHDVEHVRPGARAQPHPAAAAQLDPVDHHGVGRRPLELLPVAAHRSTRKPCSRISSSRDSDSVRSRIARARGSPARISAFSSSVRLMMLKVSSPSISPPS